MRVMKKLHKKEEQWRWDLTPDQYEVLRNKGTERPFTGEYLNHKEGGTYVCTACGQDLFCSKAKFESGTGWPSFYEPISRSNVMTETDNSMGMIRTEVMCGRCDSHLGHVFSDGPMPTGLRYCINSICLIHKSKF